MNGLRTAWIFLTRVPIGDDPRPDVARAVPWFPVVGAIVGAITAAVWAGANELLAPLPSAERRELLDHLLVETARAQVIIFTDDDLITAWAKERPDRSGVLLYEVDEMSEHPTTESLASPPEVTIF